MTQTKSGSEAPPSMKPSYSVEMEWEELQELLQVELQRVLRLPSRAFSKMEKSSSSVEGQTNTIRSCQQPLRRDSAPHTPVQLVLLSRSAGRFVLRLTAPPAASRTVKTELSSSDLRRSDRSGSAAGSHYESPPRRRSPLELRMSLGQPEEELVLLLQRSLPEDGGGPVVQRPRPGRHGGGEFQIRICGDSSMMPKNQKVVLFRS